MRQVLQGMLCSDKGAYELETFDGGKVPQTWNVGNVFIIVNQLSSVLFSLCNVGFLTRHP